MSDVEITEDQRKSFYDEDGQITYEGARALIAAGESVSIPKVGIISRANQHRLPPPDWFVRNNEARRQQLLAASRAEMLELQARMERLQHGSMIDPLSTNQSGVTDPRLLDSMLPPRLNEQDGRGILASPTPAGAHLFTTGAPAGNPQQSGVDRGQTANAQGETGNLGGRIEHPQGALQAAGVTGTGQQQQTGPGVPVNDDENANLRNLKDEDELPDNFPHVEYLGAYDTVGDVRKETDKKLLAIYGIGEKRLADIRAVAPYSGPPETENEGNDK